MTVINNQKTEYRDLVKTQDMILQELKQLKAKLMVLGSLKRFENIAEKGRDFAEKRNIKSEDVTEND